MSAVPSRLSAWALLVVLLLGLFRPLCACHAAGEPSSGCQAAAEQARPSAEDCCAGEDEDAPPAPALPGEDCCCAHSSEPRQKSPEGVDVDASTRLAWVPAEVVDGARPRGHRIAPFRRERLPAPPLLALHCRLLI